MTKTRTNYLNNKDMLEEIHKSKTSYCEFEDFEKHQQYDLIIDLDQYITQEKVDGTLEVTVNTDNVEGDTHSKQDVIVELIYAQLDVARANRAKRMSQKAYKKALESFQEKKTHTEPGAKEPVLLYKTKPKLSQFYVDPDTIKDEDLVFRVATYQHIPLAPGRKKSPSKVAENHELLCFIPFKHYVLDGAGGIREVGRSHWHNGEFSSTHGQLTPKLANMLVLLVNRYSQRANWRGYSYVDEMRGESLLQLSRMALLFNEARSDNPFAYFTTAITNSFRKILFKEKKQQKARDDLLEAQGKTPSFTRQLENEEEIKLLRDQAQEQD